MACGRETVHSLGRASAKSIHNKLAEQDEVLLNAIGQAFPQFSPGSQESDLYSCLRQVQNLRRLLTLLLLESQEPYDYAQGPAKAPNRFA